MTDVGSPGRGRYARVEREQRWVAAGVPADAGEPREIVDRYLTGTRLRLRHVRAGDRVVRKLGQKLRPRPEDPGVVEVTNLYLSAEEYELLADLPGAELRKTRWRVVVAGRAMAVDELAGRLDGLVLAEVELGPDEPRLPLPPLAVADVTDDDRFSGGALARAEPAEVAHLLGDVARWTTGAAEG